jgi:hypothetical protein
MDANMIDPRWFALGNYWPGFVSGRLRGLREMVSSEPVRFDAVCRPVTAREPCAGADGAGNEQAARLPGGFLCLCPAPLPAPSAAFAGAAFVRRDMQK